MKRRLAVVMCAIGLALGGCWSSPTVLDDAAFTGPPVTQSVAEGRHLLIVQSPTPGWKVTIDRTDPRLDEDLVFMTLERPDPGALYAQVVTEQRVLTNVVQTRPIRVYARVVEFAQRKNFPPYRPLPAQSDLTD
ncbi:MAG: hypothetical protein KJZ65_08905 [Phycisphaerales bacterium]|nr:hypothetical protein [Phycisphaerales bacterium]